MKFRRREFVLGTGEKLTVYCPTVKDAQDCADHYNIASGETDYLSTGAGEIVKTAQDEIEWLKKFEDNENPSCLLAGAIGGKIIALAEVSLASKKKRLRHRCCLGISIQKAHWRKGIGTILIKSLCQYAKKAGFEQVELEVVSRNAPAYALYQKLGFEKTGVTPNGIKYEDGTYADLIFMVKKV